MRSVCSRFCAPPAVIYTSRLAPRARNVIRQELGLMVHLADFRGKHLARRRQFDRKRSSPTKIHGTLQRLPLRLDRQTRASQLLSLAKLHGTDGQWLVSHRRRTPHVRRRRLPRRAGRCAHARPAGEHRPRAEERQFAYYNTNIHLNPTNVCVYRCRFCAFRADLKAEKAYDVHGRHASRADSRRRRRTGRPKFTSSAACIIRSRSTGTSTSSACSTRPARRSTSRRGPPVEINWFSHITKQPIDWVLAAVDRRRAWAACPAAGRRSSIPKSASRSANTKPTPTNGSNIHRTAHQLGLRSNATMLYGHVEQAEHRIDHLCQLRELQDETRRIPDVHPAGVPSGEHEAAITSPSRPA